MTVRWFDRPRLERERGGLLPYVLLGVLELPAPPRGPALELHILTTNRAGRTAAVWVDERGNVVRATRSVDA